MRIERLSAGDQMMRRVDEVWPQDNGALVLLDGHGLFDGGDRFRIELVRQAVERRLHLVPRFREVVHAPRWGLGAPLWVDAPDFDLANHVRVVPVPPPGGEAELLVTVERLRREPLDASRPLWAMCFLTGLADRRVAIFVRVNHAIADGMATMGAISAFLDTKPEGQIEEAATWRPTPSPSALQLLVDNVKRELRAATEVLSAASRPWKIASQLIATLTSVRELFAEEPAPKSTLDRLAGRDRRLALVRSSLASFKHIAHAHGASVNDVLLALTAGGLRALLQGRAELTEDFTARIYVPVSLRDRSASSTEGNRVAEMIVPLPVALPDPAAQLETISGESRRRKARARSTLVTLLRSNLVRWALMRLLDRQRVNVTSANLPGPPNTLYFAGAPVLEVFPILPLIGKAALGIAAVSYAGAFNIGIVADEKAYPDLDRFVDGAKQELAALGAA